MSGPVRMSSSGLGGAVSGSSEYQEQCGSDDGSLVQQLLAGYGAATTCGHGAAAAGGTALSDTCPGLQHQRGRQFRHCRSSETLARPRYGTADNATTTTATTRRVTDAGSLCGTWPLVRHGTWPLLTTTESSSTAPGHLHQEVHRPESKFSMFRLTGLTEEKATAQENISRITR